MIVELSLITGVDQALCLTWVKHRILICLGDMACSISILSSNLFPTNISLYISTPPRPATPPILRHHAHPIYDPSATSQHLHTPSSLGCLHHLSSRRCSNLPCDNLEVRKLSYELGRAGRSCEFIFFLVYSDREGVLYISIKKRFRVGEICPIAMLKHCRGSALTHSLYFMCSHPLILPSGPP